ncbi:MAG: hypothetical protein ACR2J3_11325 [Aridibacter sp.]
MKHLAYILCLFLSLISLSACKTKKPKTDTERQTVAKPKIIAESFAYPIGEKEFITEAKDAKDKWYNAQDFSENRHLGEDWNANSGGDTDCGEPVFAAVL